MNPSRQVEDVLGRLDSVRRAGDGWVAKCPCRDDDSHQTLSIKEGDDGRVLFKCHRGALACTAPQICKAMGIDIQDLFTDEYKPEPASPAYMTSGRAGTTWTNTYRYTDADGVLVFEVRRGVTADGHKTFQQRIPNPAGGYIYTLSGLSERPLYRLPEVLEAKQAGRIIFVVEGEKDADTLAGLGYTATCNPMGADNGKGSKWRPEMTAALAGAKVVIIADNDEPGLLHANYIAGQLTAAGSTVRRKHCPAPHKDVTDLINAGGTIADLILIDAEHEAPAPELDDDPRLVLVRDGRLVDWKEFINETTSDDYDWLIEGLLERGERVMVVAAEGVGKTTLARQVAILSGAGINPFTYCEMKPVRTLMVDLENPEKIIRRQSRRIVDAVRLHYGAKRPIDASLWMKPNGVDILTVEGRLLLENQIEQTEPELLVLGPIYKSFLDPGNKSSTALITEVTMYFDYLRSRYGCALWLEHHAPLGNSLTGRQIRPADSAVWMRWPEFGFGIALDPTAASGRREYVWEHWRGMRDARRWPARMVRGALFPFEVIEYLDAI